MPSSPGYKSVEKHCAVCGTLLTLNNTRDITRKKYCSESCKGVAMLSSRKTRSVECSGCGVPFQTKVSNQHSCSTECLAATQVNRSYKMMHNNPSKYLKHSLYKKGRELLTLEFLLDLLEEQGGLCAISGQRLTFVKIPGNGRVNTNCSIDQIEAGGGYTEDNVQLVCDVVNRMKIDMDMNELKFWCRAIMED